MARWRLRLIVCTLLGVSGCATLDEERWREFNRDGVELFAKGDYRNALDSFDYALTFRPADPVLVFNMAQCYDRLGAVKKAEELYVYSLQRDPKYADAQLALLALQYRTGRAQDANRQIQEWLQREPQSPDAYVADAWRLRQERAYPMAQARLQQAYALDGQNRRVLTEMAILDETQGMPDRALVLYQQILEREPNQLEIAERVRNLQSRGVKAPIPN